MSRDYGQYCGLARALDLVGDRWNLLIVRELLIGPARYGELRDGLTGIERRLFDGANAITYVLTPWGAELREPINALIRWSTPLMIRGPEGDEFRPDGLLVALPALFTGRVPTNHSVAVGITVEGVTIQLRATDTGIAVDRPDGRKLDAVLTAEAQLVLGLAAGVLSLDDVAALVDIDGDQSALQTIFDAPKSSANLTR